MSRRKGTLGGLKIVGNPDAHKSHFSTNQAKAGVRRRSSEIGQHPELAGVLTVGLTRGFVALIDAVDRERVSGCAWAYTKDGYASGRPKGRLVYLHVYLSAPAPGMEVDHISGDRLDCRRENMRSATHAENMRNRRLHRNNRSGVKGVWASTGGTWRARIQIDRKPIDLGQFGTIEEASAAYSAAAGRVHGEFARVS